MFAPWFNPPQGSPISVGLYRGGIFVNNVIYGVFGSHLYTVNSGGAITQIGLVSGTDPVFFGRNNKAPVPDICLVCQAGAFVCTTSTISGYPDINVGSPTCVVGFDGFLIFGFGNGDMISSNINDTTINTLNKARIESNPEGVTRLISNDGYLYACGISAIEIWGYPVNQTGFPLNRQGYNMTPGLINSTAVSGDAPEFAPAPLYVGSDNTVRWLKGAEPVDTGPPELKRLLEGITDNTKIDALSYVVDGVPFWQVNTPNFSWVFNTDNSRWHERQSYLSTRSRLYGSVFAFDSWMCGDTEANGRFLQMTGLVTTEINDPLIPQLESLPVEDFPAFISISRADFEFTTGVGDILGHDPDVTNPYAEVSWSDDGGITYTAPWLRELGRQQKSLRRITVRRTGLSGPQGRRWRIAVPSNVYFGFIGGNMTALATDK